VTTHNSIQKGKIMDELLINEAISIAQELDLAIYPVAMPNKAPTMKGFNKRRFTEDEIRDRAAAIGDGFGFCPKLTGLVVIDVDSYKPECDFEKFCDGNEMPETLTVSTGRGGTHYWFAVDYRVDGFIDGTPKGFNGFEVRVNNAVLPPTAGYTFVDPNAEIEELPEWLLNKIRKEPFKSTAKGKAIASALRPLDHADKERSLIDRVNNAPNTMDDRDGNVSWLGLGFGLHHTFVGTPLEADAREAWIKWSCKWAGADKDTSEAHAIKFWDTLPETFEEVVAKGTGYNAGTVVNVLKACGVNMSSKPAPAPVPVYDDKGGAAPRFRPTHLQDVGERKPRDFMLGTHYRRGFIGITGASGSAGKTSLALREIVSMVTGTAYTHEKVYYPNLKVAMVCEDDFQDELQHRLSALVEQDLGLDWSQYEDQFLIAGLSESTTLFEVEDNTVKGSAFYDELFGMDIDVLVLDPLSAVLGIPENDNSLVSQAMNLMSQLARESGIAIEMLHHSTKEGRKASNGGDINMASRGAGAFNDRARSVRTLRQMQQEESERFGIDKADAHQYFGVQYGKTNNGPTGMQGWYTTDIITNTLVRDGVHTGVSDPVVKPVDLKMTDVQDAATDASHCQSIFEGQPQDRMRAQMSSVKGWAGLLVAERLQLDIGENGARSAAQSLNRQRCKAVIEFLIAQNALVLVPDTKVALDKHKNRPKTLEWFGKSEKDAHESVGG